MTVTNREIVYAVKIANEAKAGIASLTSDLQNMHAAAAGGATGATTVGDAMAPSQAAISRTKEALTAIQQLTSTAQTASAATSGIVDNAQMENGIKALQRITAEYDKVAAAKLKAMENHGAALNDISTAQSAGMLSSGAADAFRLKADETFAKEVESAAKSAVPALNELHGAVTHAGDGAKGMLREFREAGAGVHEFENMIKLTVGLLVGNEILKTADEYAQLTGRIKVQTESEAELVAVRQRLTTVSMESRASLSSTVETYERLRESTKLYGKSQNDAINMTQTLLEGFKLGGASGERAAMSVQRLAMALENGHIHGLEFNGILMQAPQLARAMDEAMGKPLGTIRSLVQQGKMSTSELIDLVVKAAPKVKEEFDKIPITIKDGFTVAKNGFLTFIGEIGEKMQASNGIGTFFKRIGEDLANPATIEAVSHLATLIGGALNTALMAVTNTIDFLKSHMVALIAVMTVLGTMMTASFLSGIVEAFAVMAVNGRALTGVMGMLEKAWLGLNTAMEMNPWVALAALTITVITLLITFSDKIGGVWTLLKALGEMALWVVGGIAAYYAAVLTATALTAAWGVVTAGTTASVVALNIALKAIAIGWLIAGLAVLIGWLVHMATEVKNGATGWDWFVASIDVAAKQLGRFATFIGALFGDILKTVKNMGKEIGDIMVAIFSGNPASILSAVGSAAYNAADFSHTKATGAVFLHHDRNQGHEVEVEARRLAQQRAAAQRAASNAPQADLDLKGAMSKFAPGKQKNAKQKKDPQQTAIDELEAFIRKTQEASEEAKKLAAAEWIGPAMVRSVEVTNAGTKAYQEYKDKLDKVGISGERAAPLLARVVTAVEVAEIEKQAAAFGKLTLAIHEKMVEDQLAAKETMDGLYALDRRGRGSELALDQYKIEVETRKALAPLIKAQYDDDIQYEKDLADAIKNKNTELAKVLTLRHQQFQSGIAKAEGEARSGAKAVVDADRSKSDEQVYEKAVDAMNTLVASKNTWRQYRDDAVAGAIAAHKSADEVDKIRKYMASIRPPTTVMEAMKKGFTDFMVQLKPGLTDISNMVVNIGNKMTDTFVQLATTGKASFGDLARSVITDLLTMITKALLFKAIMGIANAIVPGSGNAIQIALAAAGKSHNGSIAGDSTGMSQSVNPAIFAGAARHHIGGIAGLGANEVPVIVNKGEAILPTVRLPNGQMGVQAAGMGGGGGGNTFAPNIGITINNGGKSGGGMSAEDSAKMSKMLEDEMGVFLQRKLEQWQRPGGPLDRHKKN